MQLLRGEGAGPPATRRLLALLALSLAALVVITWVRVGWLRTLLVDRTGTPWSYGLLGLAWLAVSVPGARAYLRAVEDERAKLRTVLAGAVVLHTTAALTLPYTSNDLFSNLAYGRMARLGLDPYASGPGVLPAGDPFRALVSVNWIDAPSVYGPVLTWLNTLAGRADTVPAAMAIFKLAMLAVTLATVGVAYLVCRRHLAPGRAAPALALFAWNPLLAYEIAGQAHNDGVMLLGLTAFVWAALGGRRLLAVAFLGLAFWAKFAIAPVVGLYLWHLARTDRRKAALGALVFVGMGVLLFLPFWKGPETLLGPLAAVRANPGRMTRSFTEIAAFFAGLASAPLRASAYRIGWTLGQLLLVVLAVRAVRRVRDLASVLHESLVWLLAYLLVASPFVLPWYLTWVLPLALVEADPRLRRLVAFYSALTLVAWCADVPELQAAVVNTWVLVLAARWWRRRGAEAEPSVAYRASAA
ncbi:polyprenol phosphomannose-dependent alpha 1,6 mannosyltransferase MptB [Anaeromyxobacter diazotrophicus]|uniref:DUF2029 domain-containing protein n=1 Tax=Anaeromyxobacter diazotrophicus TaxID=2590199 RepID=A0A7I9VPF7_9BACT|nr:polyprenol phosphomannose-dependent alpha 1,6 mannosyltransferase MptB [Anaeromyxobacter diazotrophicus]GEJ58118.1 hypothetical protein AMYX_28590 [Anaeromyxobacter diazotrophicus]